MELEGIVYVASHDLRSPLINVQGFSRKLAKNCAEIDRVVSELTLSEEHKAQLLPILRDSIPKSLGFIIGSIEKMDTLLNGLLRLSRLGRAALCYETLDIQTIMSKIVSSMAYQIEAASAQVEMGHLAPCVADTVQLNQVFSNLLDNAIKYRAEDRPLTIRIFSEECSDGVRYCVEDNGIGIHPEHLDQIWEIFHRISHNEALGEGLGLTIARRIIDRLGGSISVESAPGKGSRFYVTLPAPPVFRPTAEKEQSP
jgi:signal transduction histidine kinase